MTQSNASKLANIVAKNLTKPDPGSSRLGIRSESPGSTLSVGGTITADDFRKTDGSSVGSGGGIGTALGTSGPLSDFFYTNKTLGITETVTVDVPNSASAAYILQEEIAPDSGADLIIADGDDLVIDILGLSTEGNPGLLPGAGGRIRTGQITGPNGGDAPTFPGGLVVTGVATATSFDGPATSASGLSGTPNIVVGSVTGTTGNFSGDVSIGGTLTYEDVTNVDTVGIVTAQGGVIASGIGLTVSAGGINVTGGATLDGIKVENGKMGGSTSLSGEFDFFLEDGHVHRYNAATSGNYWPDFKVSSTKSLVSAMPNVGDTITATLIVRSSSHYLYNASGLPFKIDNAETNIDTVYVGGSAPSAPNGSGWDIYHFTIIMLNPDLSFGTPSYAVIINAMGAGV